MTSQDELAHYFEVCGYAPDDTISIVTRAAADGPLYWSFTTVAEAPRQIAARSKVNCWFSANPMRQPADRESRGSTEDVYAVRALWADLDVKPGGMPSGAAAKAVMKELSELLGAKPVAIVRSGHGYQPRWKIEGGVELHTPERFAPVIERFGRLVQLVAERFGGKADSVYDLPRIIRAPFTMNIKPELEPVQTGAWIYDHGEAVSFEKLLEVLDAHAPATEPPASTDPENRHVGIERGNAYVKSALEYIRGELREIEDWPTGKTDDRGRGWEKIQADAALRMAGLAKADWNTLPLERAKEFFVAWAPIGGGWTERDVIKKWNSQVKRAEPADPPADTDDPLAGGGHPHRSAPAESGAIWTEGDDGAAGQDGGGGPAVTVRGNEAAPGGSSGENLAPAEEGLSWRKYEWTERGAAERLIDMFGEKLRFCPPMKGWLSYEDGAWRDEETGGERAAVELFDRLYQLEGSLYSDTEYPKSRGKMTSDRAEFADWVEKQKTAAKYAATAKVVRYSKRLSVAPSAFDAEPMLLNCLNGVIDLYSGELLEHHPKLMLRRQIPVEYIPEAKARRWETFLERVMPSTDMRDYLQRIIGYSITGRTSEQVVFFHMGPPASGKSVFLRVMEAVLGEFSRVVPPTSLLNKKMEQHPTDIMGMEGRRMLQVSETAEGARLDEALLKRLSGEETITARGMGENFRDFRLVGKVHLVTNHPPHISDDPAVHRRLHLVEWNVTIPPEERDPLLAETIIREELEGVLAWAVRGTRRWTQDRLARPAEAEMARSAYLASEDEFGVFIEEELIVGAENAFTPSKDVFRRYVQWCEGQRMKPMSAVAFGRKLSARGVEPVRTREARGFKCHLQVPRWVQDPLG